MDEHEVAAMETSLPEEQPEASASGSGAACWGTCEELLLVSAVKRHGVNNWTEISAELKDRAISLNGSPLYFSEETCKHKYDSLRGRFASSSSSSMSRDEEMANGMHWFEELRKLRVAHLKRELEHYDGSIGSLQVKIKRLKAEKAQDTSVNKQLGKRIANSFADDQVPPTSSHEESVYCIPNDQDLANDHLKYSALKVCSQHPEVFPTLASELSIRLSESPGGLIQQVFSEGEQWHDAVEELHEASPITTDITVDTDVLNDHQTIDNCGGDNHRQHDKLNEVASMPIATTVTMDSFMSGSLVESEVMESKTLVSLCEDSKDHSQSPDAERVDIQQQGSLVDEAAESLVKDNDAGRDVLLSSDDGKRLQQGESMHIKEEVAFEREESLEDVPKRARAEAKIVKTERSATAISELECISGMCIDIGIPVFEQSSPKASVTDSVAIPPLFVSSFPSSDFCNAKEAVETEREVTLLVDEEAMPEQEGRLALDVDTTEYVTENLPAEDDRSTDKSTKLEGGVLTQAHAEIALDIVSEQAAEQGTGQPQTFMLVHNESLKEADEHDVRNTAESETDSPVREGLDDVTRVTEPSSVSSPGRKELPPEALKLDKDVSISTVLTGVGTKDMASRESTENLEMVSTACSPSESGGLLGISAVVPVADFVKNDSDVLRDGAIFILDKSETKGSARRSSGLLYLSEGISLDLKTNSPERHIVIALDEPNNITSLLKSTSVLADNVGANKISSSIESDILCRGEVAYAGAEAHPLSEPDGDLGVINVTSVVPDSVSRRKTRSTSMTERETLFLDKKSQGDENAMDLLRMMYGSAQETAPESTSVSVEVKFKPEAGNPATVSLSSVSAGMETSNPGETTSHTPLPADITTIVAEEPCNFDETPPAKDMHFGTDLGWPSQDVVAEETLVDVRTYASSPENRNSPDIGSLQGEAVDARGTNSKVCVHNLQCQASLPAKLDSQVRQEINQQHSDNCKDVVDGGVIVVTPPPETPESSHLESEPAIIDMKDSEDVGIAPPKNWEEIPEIVLDVKLHIAKDEDLEGTIPQPRILREVEAAKELVGSSLSSLDASEAISEVELRPTTVNSDILERVKPYTEADPMEIDKDVERNEDGSLPAMERDAELSPVEYIPGGAQLNRLPSSHEGSDSGHEQSKDGGDNDGEDEERRPGTRDCGESHVDKSEAGSPVDGLDDMSPSSRRNRKEPRVPGKLFPLLEVLRKVSNHKSAHLFKGREEDSRYNLLIRRHLDLTIVRTRLEEGSYSGSREFFRDLLLIFNNAMVYYSSGSSEFLGAKSLFAEATMEMERIFQTEALLKQDGPATRTRELKKPNKPVVGVATPPKAGQSPSSVGGTSVKSVFPSPTVTSLLDSGCRKRAVSRLGPVETSTTSEALVDLEGGAARSTSLNVVGGPSTSRAEEAGDPQGDDEEVNGRLKDTKKLQKGGVLIRGKPQREELLEGILLKNAANKGLGRVKLKDLKDEEVIKKSAVPTKTGAGKLRGERERERKREKEKERETEKGKERDEIDDDDLLRKGKSLAKLKDQDIVRKKEVETKPAPKARASIAARPSSNSYDTLAQSLARPVRGLRKPPSTNKEPTRAPEHQAKKRVKK